MQAAGLHHAGHMGAHMSTERKSLPFAKLHNGYVDLENTARGRARRELVKYPFWANRSFKVQSQLPLKQTSPHVFIGFKLDKHFLPE